ncbi:flagellar biosynthesis protein FlgA [Herbivorax sp. ANBcel31]|uniref:flagellar biosynthesis protein FlgA n=1 Tax=Herbivorax sp. ANBcel31 TaxID=3069754 RepID=UPI0027AFB551|nr:flagellar biosynthesis protein FlgA [Herbivorax sp. ANBcel31]MDQ2085691.1 flagellar biosynthesis protein FlgA [Herbivorax sp. ANBcel31]
MDLGNVKSVSPGKKLFKKILAIIFAIGVIVISYTILTNADKAATDTIEVLRVRSGEGIPAFVVLTEDKIEKYNIIKREYTEDMVLAEDISDVLGKFTKYYLRQNSIIYEDQFTDEKPLRNEWLYEMNEENEVLTLPYNLLECGGDILMPGDRVRIRVSYEVETDEPIDDNSPNNVLTRTRGRTIQTDILFESIVIKDMLNANSQSVYEVYQEVLKLDEDSRQDVMKSEDFLNNIQPRALLLEGTKEQMNEFAKYNAYSDKAFLITMLSRADSDVILDFRDEVGLYGLER